MAAKQAIDSFLALQKFQHPDKYGKKVLPSVRMFRQTWTLNVGPLFSRLTMIRISRGLSGVHRKHMLKVNLQAYSFFVFIPNAPRVRIFGREK